MKYYCLKTEPNDYSIDDLEKEGETIWDGVHNYQAINVIKTMKPRDMAYIYHTGTERCIVGLAEVVSMPYQNTEDQRYSWVVKIKYLDSFVGPSLAECKSQPQCKDFFLVTHPRLSVMPVPEEAAAWLSQSIR
jgi:predicted RNA-binding protein with PUA-like domain